MDNGAVERHIPDPGFAGDDGTADPGVRSALAALAAEPTTYGDALLALQDARLLVPVVAILGEVEVDERGLAHDKTSDMAAVLMTGADGRRALLAFTGSDSLAAWDAGARPVPVPTRLAAQSAVQDGAAALVVDIAGPATAVVEGDDLTRLAAGWRVVRLQDGRGDQLGWIGPAAE
jgi:SseB protein N-terminal domain